MDITLGTRTADTVRIYFEKARHPQIKKLLPQKAQSVEEALADYEKTLLPGAASFGQTILLDGQYIGDIWCYCIDPEDTPNCMVSFCIFETGCWSKGIATAALGLFLPVIREKYGIRTVGAFTYSHNRPSMRVLQKNGFTAMEEFEEDGVLSVYLQLEY